jgi:type I restriction enzyme S subunit
MGYLTGPSDFGSLHPIVSKWTEHPKVIAHKGDILITVKGSGVGKINLLDIDEVVISRQLMAIRTNKVETNFIYAFLVLQYNFFQSLSNGAAIPGISRKDVLNLKCPIPSLAKQCSIVAKLDALSSETKRLEEIYQQKLAALDELKKSVLQKAFNGELAGA